MKDNSIEKYIEELTEFVKMKDIIQAWEIHIDNPPVVKIGIEMEQFIWETNYPESKDIQELMKLLDYPIVGNEESDIHFKNDDFAFINVPLPYIDEYLFSYLGEFDTGEKPWQERWLDILYFFKDEYIPEKYYDFIPWLKENILDFNVEKAFDNGYEEAKHILSTLQGMMEQKLLSNEKENVDKSIDKKEI